MIPAWWKGVVNRVKEREQGRRATVNKDMIPATEYPKDKRIGIERWVHADWRAFVSAAYCV